MKRRNTRNHRRYRPAAFARYQRRLQQKGSGHAGPLYRVSLFLHQTCRRPCLQSEQCPASTLKAGYPTTCWFEQEGMHRSWNSRPSDLNIKKQLDFLSEIKLLESGRRGSNPRQPPWQGGALPLSHSREHNSASLARGGT